MKKKLLKQRINMLYKVNEVIFKCGKELYSVPKKYTGNFVSKNGIGTVLYLENRANMNIFR